jgi:hypothetical protein
MSNEFILITVHDDSGDEPYTMAGEIQQHGGFADTGIFYEAISRNSGERFRVDLTWVDRE